MGPLKAILPPWGSADTACLFTVLMPHLAWACPGICQNLLVSLSVSMCVNKLPPFLAQDKVSCPSTQIFISWCQEGCQSSTSLEAPIIVPCQFTQPFTPLRLRWSTTVLLHFGRNSRCYELTRNAMIFSFSYIKYRLEWRSAAGIKSFGAYKEYKLRKWPVWCCPHHASISGDDLISSKHDVFK